MSPPNEDVRLDPEPQFVLDIGNSVNPNPPTEWIAQLDAVTEEASRAAEAKALAVRVATFKSALRCKILMILCIFFISCNQRHLLPPRLSERRQGASDVLQSL